MCNGIRNSPIDIDFDTSGGMWMEQQESSAFADPLMFKGYASVRFAQLGNLEEHIIQLDSRANKLSNKGGHTAVSIKITAWLKRLKKNYFSKLILNTPHPPE